MKRKKLFVSHKTRADADSCIRLQMLFSAFRYSSTLWLNELQALVCWFKIPHRNAPTTSMSQLRIGKWNIFIHFVNVWKSGENIRRDNQIQSPRCFFFFRFSLSINSNVIWAVFVQTRYGYACDGNIYSAGHTHHTHRDGWLWKCYMFADLYHRNHLYFD